ncbi:MAG: hypothetical protein PF481_10140 [Bacteroidales bacterium]|jgi:hypothetical protein|nr:hypothetical protein [Bacteroidales bacterium]
MKHNYFIILSFLFLILSSCEKKTSVTFKREVALADYFITLNSDSTFRHISSQEDNIPFDETGMFYHQDTLLILDYTYDRYTHNNITFLLETDTFLIVRRDSEIVFLFPIKTKPHYQDSVYSFKDMKKSLCHLYSQKKLSEEIPNLYSTDRDDFLDFFNADCISIETYCK